MADRIAAGEIFVGLDDEQAIAGLRRVEADFASTMQRMDRMEATADLKVDERKLKKDLAKAKAELAKHQKWVKEADGSYTRKHRIEVLKRIEATEKEARAALKAHQGVMRAKDEQAKAEARAEVRRVAIERRAAQRERLLEAAEKRRLRGIKQLSDFQSRMNKQQAREIKQLSDFQSRMNKQQAREMSAAHTAALREEKDRAAAIRALERQESVVRKLQRQYSEASDKATKLARESRKIGTLASGRAVQQRVALSHAETVAKMELLRLELKAMGAKPIEQEIALDVDRRGVGTLSRWISAITETTVRIGPFTTTIAGLGRAMLVLGPIISGLVGQFAALAAVLGAGIVGAAGVAAGAFGALGISLGGVGFLMGGLVDEFKSLATLQKAWRTQVLKTGADSEKAKTKLKEFRNALGEVAPTTRRAFESLDQIGNRWNKLSQEAKPTFFNMLGQGITTVNHQFEWFRKNTLDAFVQVERGWSRWMRGLRSGEADKILGTLGEQGNKSIQPLMRGIGNLATAFGRVAVSFSRHLPSLLRGFEAWSDGLADASGRTDRLDRSADGLVGSMRAVGRFIAATGRVITAFFSPGVDDGTEMINNWSDGLNRLAHSMRTTQRSGIDDWFRDSIDTANKFWRAVAPIAELFFEWTTIMRPFANAALDVARPLAQIVQSVADLWVVRTALQVAFGLFIYGAVVKRAAGLAASMGSLARAVVAIKAAGGIGGALKGGVIRLITGGVRGTTPANPLFVTNVGPGGGGGAAGGARGGGGGLIGRLPGMVKFGGGVALAAGAVISLTAALDKLSQKRGFQRFQSDVQKLVSQRNLPELRAKLRETSKEVREWGQDASSDKYVRELKAAIKVTEQLNDKDLSKMERNINRDWNKVSRESNVTLRRVSGLAKYHFDLVEKHTKKGSYNAQQAASRNFNRAERAIKSSMKAGTISTKNGLALIERLWARALEQYGFTPKQAKAIRKGYNPNMGPTEGSAGPGGTGPVGRATGGMVQVGRRGQRGQDTVPMNLGGVPSIVAPGEQIAVFNAHQQRKMASVYPGGLEGFFSGPQPRHASVQGFQPGGIVPVPGFPGERANASVVPMIMKIARMFQLTLSDAFGPGHVSPGHTVHGTAADFIGAPGQLDKAAAHLVRAGFKVLYDGRFGTTAWPNHGPHHHLHVELGSGGGGLAALQAPEIARVMMQGDLGVMSSVGQGALDIARLAANANLEKVFESSLMTGDSSSAGGAASRSQMVAWATAALNATRGLGHGGATAGNIAKILELAMKESSWIVRSINNWDINAKQGNPSGGLMHVTLDKVGGSLARLYNPIQNMIASIQYQMSRYGGLITHSPYERGGLVDTMSQAAWERGGMIDRPTLMTGEDGRKHPEFVVGTNPMFRHSNLDALNAAANALGIGQARKSKKKKGPKPIRGASKEPGQLKPVKDYTRIQGEEEDTLRNISIAQGRVIEPDSFVKKIGKDADGNDLYAIDERAITTYTSQLEAVMKLYRKLLNPNGIMDRLAAAADRSYKRITTYIDGRKTNIDVIDKALKRDRKLAKSKDPDTARKAQRRIDWAVRVKENERQRISDARDIRGEIQEDQKDAGFRRQEYDIDRDSLHRDIKAVRPRAVEERTGANPPPPEAPEPEEGPTIFEQRATLSTGRGELLSAFGSNFIDISRIVGATSIMRAVASTNTARGINPAAVSAIGSSREAAFASSPRAAGFSTAARSSVGASAVGGAGAEPGAVAAGDNIEINNYFPTPPPDPHTWSRGVEYELRAAL
jgi:SLT domain-containing protein